MWFEAVKARDFVGGQEVSPAPLERRKREHWLLGILDQEHDSGEVSRSKGFRTLASQPSKAGLNPPRALTLTATSLRADLLHVLLCTCKDRKMASFQKLLWRAPVLMSGRRRGNGDRHCFPATV